MRRITAIAMAVWAAVVMCASGTCAMRSQRPEPAQIQSQYARTLWRIADGLPEDTVQAIVESTEGMLWIGTTGGLARFDGSHIRVPKRAQSLLANSIFTLTYGSDGSLWAGTEGGGLLRMQRNEVRTYSVHEGLTDGFVRKVFKDSRGRLWVGTDDGLFVIDAFGPHAGRLRRVDRGPIAHLAVHAITEDHAGRIWVGGSRLIALSPDGGEQEYALRGAYSQTRVKTLLETKDGRLWVGTVGGLQYFDKNKFHVVDAIHATVRTLMQANDGLLWIGTIGDGVWTLDPDTSQTETESSKDFRLTQVSGRALLPSDTVLYLFQDRLGQIWIGTQAGLVRLTRTPLHVVPLPHGGDPDFETISTDNNGDIWVAAQRLYLVHNDIARPITYGGLKNVTVRNVFRAREGALWIGTDGSGAYRVDGKNVRHFTAPSELTNNFVRGFLQTKDGAIWIAADEGVSRIATDKVSGKKLTEQNGLVFFSTRSLLQDREGALWIGTDHGLSKWKHGHFEHDAATDALAHEKVWSILEDRSGALWFGTRDHGLFRYRVGRTGKPSIRQFTAVEGLPANSIYQILQDRGGTFWITGPSMIASVAEKDMEGEPNEEHPLSVQTYQMPYEADGAQLYGGRQPAGVLSPDGSLWFPTSKGAAHLTGATQEQVPAPRAWVEEVVEDGRTVSTNGFASGGLNVAASVVRLSFAFTAISLRPQDGVRFRYKLEGFDSAWTPAGASRVATYTNLPAGRYRFRVQAFNTMDPAAVSEFGLSLDKARVFYATWWFYALCGVLLSAIVLSLYRLRVRGMRRRFAAVLEERSRLAREMHDTVIQGCTGISALLEAMASRMDEDAATSDGLLQYARVQARTTIDEARQAIWNMRHEREKDVDLVSALKGVAAQTAHDFETGNVATEVAFDHDVAQLEVAASVAHEILMTVREGVYNSVQHSRSGRVAMSLSMRGDELTIRVEDQGCGFDSGADNVAPEGHYGIVGMRERVKRLGGQMELTSVLGAGTKVQVRLRLARTR